MGNLLTLFNSPENEYLFVEDDVKYIKRLGLGSFGEVFEAEWRGELYAAKRVHEELVKYDNGGPRGIVADFRRECEHLRQLDHQNIVKLVEAIFTEGKPPVLITELLDCDLENLIKNSTTEPKVSFIDTVNIMQDVAEGLKYLHTRSDPIVHRDLASKNILLTNRKQAKIGDLGLAKAFPGVYFTSPKPTTAPYAAPETFPRPCGPTTYEKPRYGVEIDVFSFGVVLLEVLTGRLPSPDPLYSPYDKDRNLVQEHQRRREDLARLKPGRRLTQLVLRCLKNDKHDRPTAVEITELLDQLRRWQVTRDNTVRQGEIRLKIVVLGMSAVGKSAILERYVNRQFGHASATIGGDRHIQTVTHKNKQIKLCLIDTAGEERFQSGGVTPLAIRDANGAILVFDLGERRSFNALDQWHEMMTTYCSATAVAICVGNKIDNKGRAVSKEEAESYSNAKDFSWYCETSAVTGVNIDALFERMVDLIYEELELDSVVLEVRKDIPTPPKKRWQSCFIQ